MKKKILALSLAIMLAASSLSGCGGTKQTETTAPADKDTETPATETVEPVVLKVNLTQTTTDPWYDWWTDWANRVEEASEGTLKLELYTGQSLGSSAEILQANVEGSYFIAVSDFAGLADYCADASVYHVPYLIQRPEQIYELWQSDIGQEIDAKIADAGIHVIAPVYYGTRNVLCNKPVTNREEMGTIRLRVLNNKMWTFVAECLGANPTGMPWSEIYQALTQGIADGAESPSSSLYTEKFYEVCKYLIVTEHLIANSVMSMSQEVYDSLPEKAQNALDTVSAEFSKETVDLVNGETAKFDQLLKDEGVTFVEFDKEPVIEYAQTHVEEKFPEWSEGLYKRANEFLNG